MKGPFDPKGVGDPQVKNHCSGVTTYLGLPGCEALMLTLNEFWSDFSVDQKLPLFYIPALSHRSL